LEHYCDNQGVIMSSKIVIDLSDAGVPTVTFSGEYIRKSLLVRCQKALARQHRMVIRNLRRKKIIDEYKQEQELKNANGQRKADAAESKSSELVRTDSSSESAKPTVTSATRIAGDGGSSGVDGPNAAANAGNAKSSTKSSAVVGAGESPAGAGRGKTGP
jgi:hypothetical protein